MNVDQAITDLLYLFGPKHTASSVCEHSAYRRLWELLQSAAGHLQAFRLVSSFFLLTDVLCQAGIVPTGALPHICKCQHNSVKPRQVTARFWTFQITNAQGPVIISRSTSMIHSHGFALLGGNVCAKQSWSMLPPWLWAGQVVRKCEDGA